MLSARLPKSIIAQLQDRRLNPRIHIAKIMALSEIYGPDKVARAIEDAFEFTAFSSDYIANILEQRERLTVQPGPLHLTRHGVQWTPVPSAEAQIQSGIGPLAIADPIPVLR